MEKIESKTKEEKKLEKKNKLLSSSFNLFTKKGIHSTTVQDIVDKAGLAKGTFYLYFKDKYELQDELIIRKSRELFNSAIKKLDKKNIPLFVDQIIFIVDDIINALYKNKILLKFISKNLSLGIYSEKLTKITVNNSLGIHDLFIEGINKDKIQLENPEVTLYMIIELVSATTFTSIIKNEPLSIDEYKPFLYNEIRKMLK